MKMRPIEADKSAIEDAIIEEAEEYEADLDCNQKTGCNTEEAGSMTRKEKKNALHCLKVMIGEEVCEECDLYGTTGTDHCEADCVRVAIKALEHDPCQDTISRQVVRDTIFEECSSTKLDIDFAKVLLLQRAIKAVPPVTPQEPETRQWIFVNERQPEGNGYYLTTTIHREVYCDYWEGDRFDRTEAIMAWMPLPEPAK